MVEIPPHEVIANLIYRPGAFVLSSGLEGEKPMVYPDFGLLHTEEESEPLLLLVHQIIEKVDEGGRLSVASPRGQDRKLSTVKVNVQGVKFPPSRGKPFGKVLSLLLQTSYGEDGREGFF